MIPAFFIALRYLLGRAKEGGRYLRGAAAGIALSLVPIIVTLIVADGMIRGITDRYLELGTGHIRALEYRFFSAAPPLATPFSPPEDLGSLPGVRGVWEERQGIGIVMGSRGKAGTAVRAVDPAFLADPGSRRFLRVVEGSAELDAPNQVLLGEELARRTGAAPGKTIYIMSVRRAPGGNILPRTLPFTVRGVVSSGYRELDALWCIVPLEAGERLLAPEYSENYYTIKIENPYTGADAFAASLAETLGPSWDVITWKDLQRAQYSSYESTRQMLLFIMAMIVLVAAVNVSSATSMLVIERRREIAVLKAGGAGPAFSGRIFLAASFLTGTIGAAAGIALGLLIGVFVNQLLHSLEKALSFFSGLFHGGEIKILDPGFYLETIPVIIDWSTVGIIGAFTVLCSVIAAWLPARQAGKLRPMDILRRF